MEKKLYIGNLSYNIDDGKLREMFSSFGEITDARVVSDRETGRSRGFGFVTFADAEGADKAIADMNGKEIDGRKLTVNEARPPESGGGRREGGRGGGGHFGGGEGRGGGRFGGGRGRF
ncbi:RNA-binding protein [Candidatus Micrarchaeota archaeon CG1_02_47_40]|nr:MAG: RNA-binding protein [Candidatus Micrarchaeota archaeon CG1_02_47_40]